jgi:hypothetical protein
VTAAALVVVGLFATWEPAILSGYGYSFANNLVHGRRTQKPMDNETKTFLKGVMDERRYYYEATGLLKTFRANPRPNYEWSVEGLRLATAAATSSCTSTSGCWDISAGHAST